MNPAAERPAEQAKPHAALVDRVQASLQRQGMMQHLGVSLLRAAPGEVEVAMPYSDRVAQQQGGFHGGAMGALADIAGGYAALTVEYKINFLAAFQGGELLATGRVLKAGKRIIVTSAEVLHRDAAGKLSPCAVMQQTLVPVPKTY